MQKNDTSFRMIKRIPNDLTLDKLLDFVLAKPFLKYVFYELLKFSAIFV